MKVYTFKGFTINTSLSPDGIVFAMGETHICESIVYELYKDEKLIGTYDTFIEARDRGFEISKQNCHYQNKQNNE